MSIVFNNERVLASAGSGKTYNLTNRFIALLENVTPDKIYALTFTRKASGEFFEKILSKLCVASVSDSRALQLAEELKKITKRSDYKTFYTKEYFLDKLNLIIKFMPKLSLGTIDAFCAKLLFASAKELSFYGELEVLDEYSAMLQEENSLDKAFKYCDKESAIEFAQAFKQASFGVEEKKLFSLLSDFIDRTKNTYFKAPDLNVWGNPKDFSDSIKSWNQKDYDEKLSTLKKSFEKIALSKSATQSVNSIISFFENSTCGNLAKESSIIEKIFSQMREGGVSLELGRGANSYSLDAHKSSLIESLVRMLIDSVILQSCEQTKGIGKIISLYEKAYENSAIKNGKFAFKDFPKILSSGDFAISKDFVEYKFDQKYEHWLFDEFQDTSREQWNVFENLIDSVADNVGNSSVYFVGDIKQSIYAWRGGDLRLFEEVIKRYSLDKNQDNFLNISYRSSKEVIDFVNEIFSDNLLLESQFSDGAKDWNDNWQTHSVASQNENMKGYVKLFECNEDSKSREIYNLLKEINPTQKGISCAILVNKKSKGKELLEDLRTYAKEDSLFLNVSYEGQVKISDDNMIVPALVSLVKSALHPADTMAKEYVDSTILREFILENSKNELREKIIAQGFYEALESAIKFIESKLEKADEFNLRRLNQFAYAVKLFDEKNDVSLDNFFKFIENYAIKEGQDKDTICVMTMHSSKGLDFDMVILPDVEKTKAKPDIELKYFKSGDKTTVISMPKKLICSANNTLFEMSEFFAKERLYESICKYYVATTRSKNALYIFANTPPKTSTSKGDFRNLLFNSSSIESFKEGRGVADWYKDFSIENEKDDANDLVIGKINSVKNYEFIKASKSFESGENPFDSVNENLKLNLGKEVHEIFEKIEFKEDFNFQKTFASDLIYKSLQNSEVAKIFTSEPNMHVWREKNFDVIINDSLLSGIFDRVNIYRDEKGNIISATIVDFKTDYNCDERILMEKHSHQLRLYKNALSQILNLESAKIATKLLSVKNQKLIDVD